MVFHVVREHEFRRDGCFMNLGTLTVIYIICFEEKNYCGLSAFLLWPSRRQMMLAQDEIQKHKSYSETLMI